MKADEYLNQFNVLGKDEYINCDTISHLLYAAYLNRFIISLTEDEYQLFYEYQNRIYDLVENMRELEPVNIDIILKYLNKQNPYVVDIVIMSWCLPRADDYLSVSRYNNKFKENITKYLNKLIKIIDNQCIKNFCCETLTKTNYVPIHCVDLLWYYMNSTTHEFEFYNMENARYIGFSVSDHNDTITIGFNMEYLLEMGLGRTTYDVKGSFRNLLKTFVTNVDVIKMLLSNKTNYSRQLFNIINDSKKYFDEELPKLPEDIITLINSQQTKQSKSSKKRI